MAKNRLEIILSGNVRDFNRKLKEARQTADDSFGAISSAAQSTSVALGAVGIAGSLLAKSFVDKSVEMQKFRGTLVAVTKDVDKADAALQKMVKFAATTPFDLPGVVDAGVKLQSLKVDVDTFLPLAGDLAAVFGRSIPDAALALGKAATGSQDGLTQLADSFGIAKKELIEFGAASKDGKTIDVTNIDKLQAALQKVIASKYGGAMAEQAKTAGGAFANLSDAVDQLKAALGDELADDFAKVAKAVTEMVQEFNELPDPTKRMIAQSVILVTALAGIGAAASGLIAVFGPLVGVMGTFSATVAASTPITWAGTRALAASGAAAAKSAVQRVALTGAIASSVGPSVAARAAMTGLASATRAMLLAMGPVGVVVALGAAAAGLVHAYGKSVKAAEEGRIAQQKMADRFRESRKEITLAATALREYAGELEGATASATQKFIEAGKTDLDAVKAIVALQEQRNEASKQGDEARAQQLLDRINVLRGVQRDLQGTGAAKAEADKKAAEDAKKALEEQSKLEDQYQKRSAAGFYETKKAQLQALDEVLVGMKARKSNAKPRRPARRRWRRHSTS